MILTEIKKMAKLKPDTISLKGNPLIKERPGTGTIRPGHALKLLSTGNVSPQDVAGSDGALSFALENVTQGKEISETYSSTDMIRYGCFSSGQEVYARLPASAAVIVIGDALSFSTGGTVKKRTGTEKVIGFALEAVDNHSGTSEVFISMEIK
jgi:hypothetical protein